MLVVDPTISSTTFEKQALWHDLDEDPTVVEIERRDTAAESVEVFTNEICRVRTPGAVLDEVGLTARFGGLVLIMKRVGVVLRHADGSRVVGAAGSLPTLWWIASNPTHLVATFDKYVARTPLL